MPGATARCADGSVRSSSAGAAGTSMNSANPSANTWWYRSTNWRITSSFKGRTQEVRERIAAAGNRLKHDHAARVAAGLQVGKRLRRFFDAVGAGDEFVQLELLRLVQCDQPREVLARTRRAVVAAGEGLFLEGDRGRLQRSVVVAARHAHHQGRAALAQGAEGLLHHLAPVSYTHLTLPTNRE